MTAPAALEVAAPASLVESRQAWQVLEYRDDETGVVWTLWPGDIWRSASVGYEGLAALMEARGEHLVPTRVSSVPALVRHVELLERAVTELVAAVAPCEVPAGELPEGVRRLLGVPVG